MHYPIRPIRLLLMALTLSLALPIDGVVAQEEDVVTDPATSVLDQRAKDVVRVLQGDAEATEVFAPGFLSAVPEVQLAQISAQLTTQFGPLIGVERVEPRSANTGTVYLRFERAIGSGNMVIEPEQPQRVTGLLLQTFEAIDDNAEKVAADLEALPGDVSVLFAPPEHGAAPILSVAPDKQLAIGSTFKLYVLAALAEEIESGKRDWGDVVELNVKSFPSGTMHRWPQGSPVTLHTLASMMIAGSDNTATDQLIRVLGRKKVEDVMAASGHSSMIPMRPLLTTLDLFKLKGNPELAREWSGLGQRARRKMLAEFEAEHDWKSDSVTGPTFVEPTAIDDIEWFANTRDLARLMRVLIGFEDDTAIEIMGISPSLPAGVRKDWAYVGYKGGSEPGVLNLTWLLRKPSGEWYMLAMSWNNPAANVDHRRFELLSQRILALAD